MGGPRKDGEDGEAMKRKPLTHRDFEAAAATDLEAAIRRRRESELLKARWLERNPTEPLGRRILNAIFRLLGSLS